MQAISPRDLVIATLADLPSNVHKEIKPHQDDPQQFKKGDSNIWRIRILPTAKTPVRFWSNQWCFYEIGVGQYGEGLALGEISFVQFPYNERCGKGQYLEPVIKVLRQLHAERPAEFSLSEAQNKKESIIFKRRYSIPSFPIFPTSVAAKDLAWLIQESLPQFQAISP